jgi:hypothetical protein
MTCHKSKWKITTNTGTKANDTNPIEIKIWVITTGKQLKHCVMFAEGKENKW